MPYDVIARVTALNTMTTSDLQALWFELFQRKATTDRQSYLIQHIAYRLQEIAYGGLEEKTQNTLNAMIHGVINVENNNKRLVSPPIGTKLLREYRGVEHCVMVIRGGFEYQGKTFKSLSEIARVITGTRWSGPLFFGLKSDTRTTKKKQKQTL